MLNTNTRPDKIMPEALNYLMDGGKYKIITKEATLYALSIGFNLAKNPNIQTL